VWEPTSGQLTLDFAVSEVADATLPVARRAMEADGRDDGMTADDWYDTAVDLEAVSMDEAIDAYRRALELDPSHSDAHLNMGRLLHEAGRIEEAEEHYRRAVSADPESARAFYNLGVALEDQSAAAAAMEAYQAARRLDPELAVAHFNLSRLLEAEGRQPEALAHLAEYKKILDRGGIGA
ncbi:MAG TPA: tetratricopeptide repeat protein, partial [Longimicrobiales bacterium]|nr:tetratricopeptide repeat protein [Longimicrobiales bacterium]